MVEYLVANQNVASSILVSRFFIFIGLNRRRNDESYIVDVG